MQDTIATDVRVNLQSGDAATQIYQGTVFYKTERLNGGHKSVGVEATLHAPYTPGTGFVGTQYLEDVVKNMTFTERVTGVDKEQLLEEARRYLAKQYLLDFTRSDIESAPEQYEFPPEQRPFSD